MLVFVAGGSGAIGRPLVSRLARAGHNVVATTRSAERAQLIRDAGAEPVVVDAFDADAFRRAIVSAKPDVVVHQMTALAKPAADYASWLTDTNRLRGEVTAVLVDAAREAGASRVVAQSASFMTAPEGPDVLDEQAPLYFDAPGPIRDHVVANAAMEKTVTGTEGIDGAVLRYGFFYGPRDLLRARAALRGGRPNRPDADRRGGQRPLPPRPHRRRSRSRGPRDRAGRHRHLQRRGRRTCSHAGVGALPRPAGGRAGAAHRGRGDRRTRTGPPGGLLRQSAPRRGQRQGAARAGLDAHVPHLVRGVPRRLRVRLLTPVLRSRGFPGQESCSPASAMFVTSGAISRSSTSTRTQLAAEAAVAAAAQGAFWQMHNVLLCHQGDLAALDLVRYAENPWPGRRTVPRPPPPACVRDSGQKLTRHPKSNVARSPARRAELRALCQ